MKLSEERLEAAACAVMKRMGFQKEGSTRLLDRMDNPRVREWVELARVALTARSKRRSSI